MDKNRFLTNMYDDFFGMEELKKQIEIENAKLTEEIAKIEVKPKEKSVAKNIDEEINNLLQAIDSIYITESSKVILKKIIGYMKKYSEKIENEHIQFNMCLYLKDEETISKIIDILESAINLFNYSENGSVNEI